MRERIERIDQDQADIQLFFEPFWNKYSPTRILNLRNQFQTELGLLKELDFDALSQSEKVDYLLLKEFLLRTLRDLPYDERRMKDMEPLLPFAPIVTELIENRQSVDRVNPKDVAGKIAEAEKRANCVIESIRKDAIKIDRFVANEAAEVVHKLAFLMGQWFNFYKNFDPVFTWWVSTPCSSFVEVLKALSPLILENLVGIAPGDEDTIVGQPIGRDALLSHLESEFIPYTPEELLEIGMKEYVKAETEMKKASRELGYGDQWKKALEHVKTLYVEPGEQIHLTHKMAAEAVEYVETRDMVTIPPIAKDYWRTYMLSPAQQKFSPFFLGGTTIKVASPTSTMSHEAKLMSMRGNNIHFSRATVFHELNPGHHLQFHMKARHNQYRGLFTTPFWIEGWSLYWEMILYERGDFFKSPEDRVGTLFWRMHRCARIIFSIKFHLGQMTPQECIDLLVDWVGHERSTAEGEVRRSFNGGYGPLYQGGYMLGALQIRALRKELVDEGQWTERKFHDRILKENEMPIEMLRALMGKKELHRNSKTSWRFYT